MTTSVYSTNNINDDIITKSLIYKQLNPPLYRIHKINSNSSIGSMFSKALLLKFNVQGKGVLSQYILYDINNKIAKDRFYYYSEDWMFCHRWKTMGGSIFVDVSILLTHTGTEDYKGSFISTIF